MIECIIGYLLLGVVSMVAHTIDTGEPFRLRYIFMWLVYFIKFLSQVIRW